jgi:hypothetical protein
MGRHLVGRRTGMRSTRVKAAIAVAVIGVAGTTTAAVAGGGKTRAKLNGFQEVPAKITPGKGKLKLKINESAMRIGYELSYSGLEAAPAQAHIHIGQRTANGDIAAFLCGGDGTPPCPPSGTVTGSIEPADIKQTTQGVEAGDWADFLRAIRAGVTYGNVHTAKYPGGEIRGQIRGGDDDD